MSYLVLMRAVGKDDDGPCIESGVKVPEEPDSDWEFRQEIIGMYRVYFESEPDRVGVAVLPWTKQDGRFGFGMSPNSGEDDKLL